MTLVDLFNATFTVDIRDDIVDCLQQAYAASLTAHDPSVGHDAASFGFLNYKSRVHYLKQLKDESRGITLARSHPFFSLQIGPFFLSSYNAGDSSETELARCFPRNRLRARNMAHLNAGQLLLELNLPEPDDANCRHLILCDTGDAIFGLRTVFVGVPVDTDKGRISQWSRIFPIWEKPAMDFSVPEAPKGPLAPVESVQPVTLTLKPRSQILPEQK